MQVTLLIGPSSVGRGPRINAKDEHKGQAPDSRSFSFTGIFSHHRMCRLWAGTIFMALWVPASVGWVAYLFCNQAVSLESTNLVTASNVEAVGVSVVCRRALRWINTRTMKS
jgi:hypothetical protein